MTVGIDRAVRVLREGAGLVTPLIDALGDGWIKDRAHATRCVYEDLTWCESRNGGEVRALEDTRATDTFLVLFPDREAHLLPNLATFQTDAHSDGTIRIDVRTASLTRPWAGLGLFHELSHAYDFRSGVEPRNPTEDEYQQGEARAYHLEMVLLDAMNGGRLGNALESVIHTPIDPAELVEPGHPLVDRVEQLTAGPRAVPPASDSEIDIRTVLYTAAVLIASHLRTADPMQIQDPHDAAEPLGEWLRAASSQSPER